MFKLGINIGQIIFRFTIYLLFAIFITSCSKNVPQNKPIQQLQNGSEEQIVDVAIVLPILDETSDITQEYVKMIKKGLSNSAKVKIRVTSYDSSSEENIKNAAEKILYNNTKIIIGPIFSEQTKTLVNLLKEHEIFIFSLSNNPVLADKNVFILGHAPIKQMEKIVKHMLDHNHHNFITLFPSGYHSQTVVKILQDMMVKQDGILVRTAFYNASDDDNIDSTLNVVADSVEAMNEVDTNVRKPVILLSDDPRALVKLIPYIKKYNLDSKATLAGDCRVNLDSNEYQLDIITTSSKEMLNSDIMAQIKDQEITDFNFMHALSYDAGKIVGEYIGEHWNYDEFLAKANSGIKFHGLSGTIHFVDSISIREYDVIKKENGSYVDITNQE